MYAHVASSLISTFGYGIGYDYLPLFSTRTETFSCDISIVLSETILVTMFRTTMLCTAAVAEVEVNGLKNSLTTSFA